MVGVSKGVAAVAAELLLDAVSRESATASA